MRMLALALSVGCWVPSLLLAAFFWPPIAVVGAGVALAAVCGFGFALAKARAR